MTAITSKYSQTNGGDESLEKSNLEDDLFDTGKLQVETGS